MPFLFNEDAALQHQLQGILVHDPTEPPGGRKVKVRYRSPEDEVATYNPPLILIEMPVLSMAFDRMHDGEITLPYAPEGYAGWWPDNQDHYNPDLSPYYMDFPIAYDITYQLTVYTRIIHHLLPIMAELEQESRLGRYSALSVPQDGTFRRVTRLGGPERGYPRDELNKRLFTATYLIRVPTEVVPIPNLPPLVTNVRQVAWLGQKTKFDYSPYYNDNDVTGSEVAYSRGILSTRRDTRWNTMSRDLVVPEDQFQVSHHLI